MGRSEDVEDALSRMKRDFLPHSIAQQIASVRTIPTSRFPACSFTRGFWVRIASLAAASRPGANTSHLGAEAGSDYAAAALLEHEPHRISFLAPSDGPPHRLAARSFDAAEGSDRSSSSVSVNLGVSFDTFGSWAPFKRSSTKSIQMCLMWSPG